MKGRKRRRKLRLKALQQQMASAIKTEWAVVYHSGFSACFITSSDSGIFFVTLKRGYDHFLPLEMKLILQQLRERERCHVLISTLPASHIDAARQGYRCRLLEVIRPDTRRETPGEGCLLLQGSLKDERRKAVQDQASPARRKTTASPLQSGLLGGEASRPPEGFEYAPNRTSMLSKTDRLKGQLSPLKSNPVPERPILPKPKPAARGAHAPERKAFAVPVPNRSLGASKPGPGWAPHLVLCALPTGLGRDGRGTGATTGAAAGPPGILAGNPPDLQPHSDGFSRSLMGPFISFRDAKAAFAPGPGNASLGSLREAAVSQPPAGM